MDKTEKVSNVIIRHINLPTDYENMGLRRIPVGEFLKLKKNALRVYAELQRLSYWNRSEEHRYIPMWQISNTEIAKTLNMSRTTVISKLKELDKAKLIKYIASELDEKYIILPRVGDYYVLVDLQDEVVLDILNNQDSCMFKTYLFHKSFHTYAKSKGNSNYTVTLEYIAETIGTSPTNLDKIIRCNKWLSDRCVISITKTYNKDRVTLKVKENNTYTFHENNENEIM